MKLRAFSRITLFLCLTVLSIAQSSSGVIAKNDIKTIRERIVSELMKYEVEDKRVESILETFKQDGRWAGINYVDVSRTGFQHKIHASNIQYLATAYKKKESKFYKNRKVKQTVEKALRFWVENDFVSDNWWYNQIGVPTHFVSVMLLMGNELSDDLVQKVQPVIGRANMNASGARPSGDRVKIASILAKNLIFLGNNEQFNKIIEIIEGEVKFATKRGMQYDYSFHHRLDRANNTISYGLGYANAFTEWAYYVAGTGYSFSDDKLNQLIDYFLDGICKHLVYGKYIDPGAKNRSITRKSNFEAFDTSIPEKLALVSDYRKNELEDIVNVRKGIKSPELEYCSFFWHSEHLTFQRPDFFTSVRMYSTRNANMEEPYNSEGLLNHHKGDGANHILLEGNEYHGIWPVFDWQKVPGTTVLQKPKMPSEKEVQKRGLADFTGGVTDGKYGAAAFNFVSPHDPLKVRKAWFFFDNEFVCLGSGITSRTDLPVVTTINQCLLDGDVFVMKDKKLETLKKGEYTLQDIDWVLHDGIGYIFPKASHVNLKNSSATGNWYKINKQHTSSKDEVKLDVFKLWVDHGKRVGNGTYEYIVVPGTNLSQMVKSKGKVSVEALSNTSALQAVYNKELEIYQLIFYKAGQIELGNEMMITCDSPGMIMLQMKNNKINKVSVSDPNRELGKIHFSIASKIETHAEGIQLSWNESTKMSDVSISLPQGVYAGKSVTIKL